MVRPQNTEAGRLQGAVLAGATFLLLLIAPLAQGDPDLEDLAWPPGSTTEDMPPQSQPLLFLPQQLAAVERAKRTGLSNDGMRGGFGGMGGLGGTGMGGGGGMGPSLSIVNPLDVLRQRLLLEMVRRRMRQSEDQIQANREMLNSVGKRSVSTQQESGADLRGLLLRRHTRSTRNDGHPASAPRNEQQATSPQQSPSGGGVSL